MRKAVVAQETRDGDIVDRFTHNGRQFPEVVSLCNPENGAFAAFRPGHLVGRQPCGVLQPS